MVLEFGVLNFFTGLTTIIELIWIHLVSISLVWCRFTPYYISYAP